MPPHTARRAFLTARWTDLVIATYPVPDRLLRPLLPPGVDLDPRDGVCLASLVGFRFFDTRVFRVRWPWHGDFPQFNLRFYVRQGDRRGVRFVREYAPKRIVGCVARSVYNERYRTAPIVSVHEDDVGTVTAAYSVTWAGRSHVLRAQASKPAYCPEPGRIEHYVTDLSWGFGTTRRGRPLRFEVDHPAWAVYPVRVFEVDVDWGLLFGREWACMNGVDPASVVLAAGSAVSVHRKVLL